MSGPRRSPVPEPQALSDELTGLSRENSVYRRTIAVCDQLAAAAMSGSGPCELTGVFAELVDKRVVLLDASFAPRAQAGGGPDARPLRWNRSDRSIDRLLRALAAERRPLRVPPVPGSLLEHSCLIAPVVVADDTLGYLLVLDRPTDEPDEVDLLTATYAATLFALTLAHERTSTQLGLRYQRAVVDSLVSGHFLDTADARDKARALGLAEGRRYRVGVLRGPQLAATEELLQRVSATAPGTVAAIRDGAVVVLVPEPSEPTETTAPTKPTAPTEPSERDDPAAGWPAIATELACTCGWSEPQELPEQAPHGLRQAEQAIHLGVQLGRTGQVIRYDELGIYRLLLQIGDLRELWSYAADVLGSLISYDARHKLDLVRTLSVYLANQGSLKQAARSLGLHPNTVAYRAQRIEQLTGLDLGDPEDRLVAHVAVKIIEAQRSHDS